MYTIWPHFFWEWVHLSRTLLTRWFHWILQALATGSADGMAAAMEASSDGAGAGRGGPGPLGVVALFVYTFLHRSGKMLFLTFSLPRWHHHQQHSSLRCAPFAVPTPPTQPSTPTSPKLLITTTTPPVLSTMSNNVCNEKHKAVVACLHGQHRSTSDNILPAKASSSLYSAIKAHRLCHPTLPATERCRSCSRAVLELCCLFHQKQQHIQHFYHHRVLTKRCECV